MYIKDGFLLKNVADEWIVMPTGKNIKQFEGAIVLSEVAAFLWKQLERPTSREDLLRSVVEEYDVSKNEAAADLDVFLSSLKKHEILELDRF